MVIHLSLSGLASKIALGFMPGEKDLFFFGCQKAHVFGEIPQDVSNVAWGDETPLSELIATVQQHALFHKLERPEGRARGTSLFFQSLFRRAETEGRMAWRVPLSEAGSRAELNKLLARHGLPQIAQSGPTNYPQLDEELTEAGVPCMV